MITSKIYKDRLLYTGEKAGSTRQALTKSQLQNFSVQLPDLIKQGKIINVLDALKKKTKHLESIYQQKISALSELKQSILQKAFNGELTADAKAADRALSEASV
jgi:type I restriction enzyme S subunit